MTSSKPKRKQRYDVSVTRDVTVNLLVRGGPSLSNRYASLTSARLTRLFLRNSFQKTALKYVAGKYEDGISLLLQDSRNCSLEHSSILLSLRQRDIPMASEMPPRQKNPLFPLSLFFFLPREEKRSFPARPSSRNELANSPCDRATVRIDSANPAPLQYQIGLKFLCFPRVPSSGRAPLTFFFLYPRLLSIAGARS